MQRLDPINKTIKLYSRLRWKDWFARIRFWDAPYQEVEKLIPKKGEIIDLGCGEGIFTNYLALKSKNRKIFGIDKDGKKIKQARFAASVLTNVKFVNGDVTSKEIPNADIIIMFHLLHHLNSYKSQEELVRKCVGKIKKRGKLIIVEAEPKFSFKYLITWATDHFLVPWLFEKRLYSPIFFRKGEEWVKLFKKSGFSCTLSLAEKGKPFTHIILECQKR